MSCSFARENEAFQQRAILQSHCLSLMKVINAWQTFIISFSIALSSRPHGDILLYNYANTLTSVKTWFKSRRKVQRAAYTVGAHKCPRFVDNRFLYSFSKKTTGQRKTTSSYSSTNRRWTDRRKIQMLEIETWKNKGKIWCTPSPSWGRRQDEILLLSVRKVNTTKIHYPAEGIVFNIFVR